MNSWRKEKWRCLQLTDGHTQQQGRDQQDRAGGHSPCAVAMVIPMAVAPVGPITVVAKTAVHLCSGADAMSLVAESLVRARLHHGAGSCDGGAGVSVLRAGGGALSITVVIIGRHARVTFEGVAFTDRTGEST